MKVTRVAHVSLNVEGNLDDTRRFYRDVLNIGDVPRPDIPGVTGHWHLGQVAADRAIAGEDPRRARAGASEVELEPTVVGGAAHQGIGLAFEGGEGWAGREPRLRPQEGALDLTRPGLCTPLFPVIRAATRDQQSLA